MKKVILLVILFVYILSACTTVKSDSSEAIYAFSDKAKEYFEKESYSLAKAEMERALALSKKKYGEQSKETAGVYLKTALYSSTTFESAIGQIQLAKEIFKNSNDMSGLAKTYETYETYGRIYSKKYNFKSAKSAYEDALKY